MSDIVKLNSKMVQPRCRIAYTLGRIQPVLCTILGNDPFFFDIDEEALADEFDAALALDGARFDVPEALRAARTASEGFITLGDDDAGLPMTDDLVALCRDALAPCAELDFSAALALLNRSETGRQILSASNAEIVIDAKVERSALDGRTIRLNPGLDTTTAALMIARECRRLELADVAANLRNPDNAILLNRALQAELITLPVQVAWELNLGGDRDAWEALSTGTLADLAYAFGHRAINDFRALRDGRAAMAAFDQWFYSGRTRKADRSLIQSLLSMSDELQNAPFAGSAATLEALRKIGERGIGRNYLLDNMMNVMQDGFYADVRDRSNANFLWFVKFERSYRAAEAFVEATTDTVKEKNIPHGGATILAFPDMMAKRAAKKGKKEKAELVDLTARRS